MQALDMSIWSNETMILRILGAARLLGSAADCADWGQGQGYDEF